MMRISIVTKYPLTMIKTKVIEQIIRKRLNNRIISKGFLSKTKVISVEFSGTFLTSLLDGGINI